jgi:hypothetical protein
LNIPPAVSVSGVPVVPESVIVEAFAVRVPVEPMVSVVPESARLVPSEVFSVPFTVMVPRTGEATFIVIVTPLLIVILSPVAGIPPAPEQPHKSALFTLPFETCADQLIERADFTYDFDIANMRAKVLSETHISEMVRT